MSQGMEGIALVLVRRCGAGSNESAASGGCPELGPSAPQIHRRRHHRHSPSSAPHNGPTRGSLLLSVLLVSVVVDVGSCVGEGRRKRWPKQ